MVFFYFREDLIISYTPGFFYKPFIKNLIDWLRVESRSFDCPVIVENFRPLQVNVETPVDVSPHEDICNI